MTGKAGEQMGWFHEWWIGVGLTGQIMVCAAVPMTVVLLLQLALMIIGADFSGDSDFDIDADGPDIDADGPDFEVGTEDGEYAGSNPSSVRVITIRGIVAFFALGGWAGLAALTSGIAPLWSIMISLVTGAAAMLLASFVLHFALRMQSSGNINLKYAVSHIADVYITIPPHRANIGKVTMVLQDRFVELDAVTDDEVEIRPNTKVEIIGVADKECLLVRPVSE